MKCAVEIASGNMIYLTRNFRETFVCGENIWFCLIRVNSRNNNDTGITYKYCQPSYLR
jgi:hypothetical protein